MPKARSLILVSSDAAHRFEARDRTARRLIASARRRRPRSSSGSTTRGRLRRGFSSVAELPDIRAAAAARIRAVRSRAAGRSSPVRGDACCSACGTFGCRFSIRASPRARAALALLRLRRLGVRDFRVLRCAAQSVEDAHVTEGGRRARDVRGTPRLPDARAAQMIVEVERLTAARPPCGSRADTARSDRRIRSARRSQPRRRRRAQARPSPAGPRTRRRGEDPVYRRARSISARPRRRAGARGHGVSRPRTDRPRTTERCRADLPRPRIPRHRRSVIPRRCCFRRSRSRVRCCGRDGTRTRDRYWKRSRPSETPNNARGTGAWPHGCESPPMRSPMHGGSSSARGQPASGLSPVIESVVRECEAAVQGRLGDVDALRIHVANWAGCRPCARACRFRRSNCGSRYIEGLHRAERFAQARAAARHLGDIRGGAVPPLLKSRIDSVLERAQQAAVGARGDRFAFQRDAPLADDAHDLDGLRELLASSHQLEDESEALARAAHGDSTPYARARRGHLRLAATPRPRLLASSGTASDAHGAALDRHRPTHPAGALRQLDRGSRAHPVPRTHHRALWRCAGMSKGPRTRERALAFGAAAAAAVCAPLVYVLIERQDVPAATGRDVRSRRRQPGNRRSAESHRSRGERAVHGASRRGERIGQRARGARHSSGRLPPRAPFLRVQLRGDARRSRRRRAVRPCEGRVHGRRGRAARAFRKRRRRHGVSRRSRRVVGARAGQGAARAAGRRDSAHRRELHEAVRCATGGGDESLRCAPKWMPAGSGRTCCTAST